MSSTRDANAEAGAARSTFSQQQLGVGVAFFAFILIGANDGGLGILLPSIGAHYGVDKGTAALLFPSGTIGYLTAALTSGLLLERFGRRVFLAMGAVIFTLAALFVASQPPFALLLLALICAGFGVGILDAGLNAYIAGLPRSTGLLNFLHAFYGAGALLGPVIASAIITASWQWSATYLVWAGAGIVAAVGFSLLFEPRAPVQHGEEHVGGNVLRATFRLPVVWVCAVILLTYVGAEVSLGSWTYTLLTEDRHILALHAAWMVSGYWLGLTAGRVVLGRIADRIGSRRLIDLCLAGVVLSVVIVWVSPVGVVTALGLWLAGFSLGPIFPTIIAVLSDLVAPRLQQSAIGLAASLGSMGGAAFPFIAGNLAQHIGLWTLLPYVVVLTLIIVALWAYLQRTTSAASAQA